VVWTSKLGWDDQPEHGGKLGGLPESAYSTVLYLRGKTLARSLSSSGYMWERW